MNGMPRRGDGGNVQAFGIKELLQTRRIWRLRRGVWVGGRFLDRNFCRRGAEDRFLGLFLIEGWEAGDGGPSRPLHDDGRVPYESEHPR